jgi:hypothetical protein
VHVCSCEITYLLDCLFSFTVLLFRAARCRYIDLDEARDTERAGGPVLRAFTKFIDVERPASASTQHVVALAVDVAWDGSNASLAESGVQGIPGGFARRSSAQSFNATLIDPFEDRGGLSPMFMVRISGVVRQLLHLRYQHAGCSDSMSIAAGGGAERHGDSASWVAPAGEAWQLIQSAQAGDEGQPSPYMSGCYASAHLQTPSVHLRCSSTGAGIGSTAAAALAAALPNDSGSWTPVPVVLTSGVCEPALAPVPVGQRSHAALVRTLTAIAALFGSLLVVWSAAASRDCFADSNFNANNSSSHPLILVNPVTVSQAPLRSADESRLRALLRRQDAMVQSTATM